ncbi:GNAT family N-acetyltransferase [Streptomyces sp. H27-D2]|uniref:GNAT family N-acetyltransferase n=1 Tax=Streptomyces sp. H27-D2 TaxID=3046304 RepID=UPI002DB98D5F|nr:GNAT family N-acetyltransferase [Streptomyces sp. H27-D2]MEC4018584.1 GNAT family N-acetyltransferase [Streptomyces sp. H27-D2]
MHSGSLDLRQVTSPSDVTPELRQALTDCWIEVTNAGGAAGFPFPPIDATQAAPAVDNLAKGLAPESSRLLTATVDGELAGWLNIRRDAFALVAHWGTLHHVQTLPAMRGRGIGVALMHAVREVARADMGLEQLHLAARAGAGLEDFYGRLGWKEIGRWPGALRLAPDDDRDEILMILAPLQL